MMLQVLQYLQRGGGAKNANCPAKGCRTIEKNQCFLRSKCQLSSEGLPDNRENSMFFKIKVPIVRRRAAGQYEKFQCFFKIKVPIVRRRAARQYAKFQCFFKIKVPIVQRRAAGQCQKFQCTLNIKVLIVRRRAAGQYEKFQCCLRSEYQLSGYYDKFQCF